MEGFSGYARKCNPDVAWAKGYRRFRAGCPYRLADDFAAKLNAELNHERAWGGGEFQAARSYPLYNSLMRMFPEDDEDEDEDDSLPVG